MAIRVTARLMASRIRGLGSLFTASVKGAGFLSLPASPISFAWRPADSFRLLPKRISGVPDAFFDLCRGPLHDNLGLGVLLEVPDVRRHAAPDLEHLPFYALG